MCVILDTNNFARVFRKSNVDHNEYKPVLEWIINRNGIIIYGGSKYMKELRGAIKYLRIFNLLSKINKAKKIEGSKVDKEEKKIGSIISKKAFNDKHLAAIVIVSKCRVICTDDSKSFKYLKDKRLYRGKVKRPLFYTSRGNSDLLCDKNIVPICRPCEKLNKHQRETIMRRLDG